MNWSIDWNRMATPQVKVNLWLLCARYQWRKKNLGIPLSGGLEDEEVEREKKKASLFVRFGPIDRLRARSLMIINFIGNFFACRTTELRKRIVLHCAQVEEGEQLKG